MKKLVLSLVAASLAATSFAQGHNNAPMGGLLLYGIGSFSNTHGTYSTKYGIGNTKSTDQPRMLNWEVSPGLGFNVMDNLTIGVDFNYTGSKTTYDRSGLNYLGNIPVDQTKSFDYAVGPFVRWTCPIGEHFFMYDQLEAHYLRGRYTNRYVTAQVGGNSFVADDSYKGVDVSLTPAIGIMVTHSLGLSFGIGGISYAYTKWDYSPTNEALSHSPQQAPLAGSSFSSKNNDLNITFGNQFNIGIQKYIGCGRTHHKTGEMMDDTRHMDTSDDANDNDADNGGHKKKKNRRNDDE